MIMPKVFHFIWVGGGELPNFAIKLIKSWKDKHPDWEIKIWDDAMVDRIFLKSSSPYFLFNEKAYLSTDINAKKADLLRLEILFWFGGVYLDVDFLCLKNIEEIIKDKKIFVAWSRNRNDDWIDTAIIGSVPHNKSIWKGIVDAGVYSASFPEMNLVFSTGPGSATRVWKDDAKVFKFNDNIFYPFHYAFGEEFRGVDAYPDSYAAHLYLSSWTQNPRAQFLNNLLKDL